MVEIGIIQLASTLVLKPNTCPVVNTCAKEISQSRNIRPMIIAIAKPIFPIYLVEIYIGCLIYAYCHNHAVISNSIM